MSKLIVSTGFWLTLLAAAYSPNSLSDTIDDLNVKPGFKYLTQQSVKVDITLLLPAAERAGVALYDETDQGRRLLQARVTNTGGLYSGSMLFPSYLKEVTVQARYRDKVVEMVVPIQQRRISATLDLYPG